MASAQFHRTRHALIAPPETDGDPSGIELIGELIVMLKAVGIGSTSTSEEANLDDAVLGLFVSSLKQAPGDLSPYGCRAEPAGVWGSAPILRPAGHNPPNQPPK